MPRSIVVPIVFVLLVAGCSSFPIPRPTPTATPEPTDLSAHVTFTPTSAPPTEPEATATIAPVTTAAAATVMSPLATPVPARPGRPEASATAEPAVSATATPVDTATPTRVPTIRPPDTVVVKVASTRALSPTRTPTRQPTPRPPTITPAPAPGAGWQGEYFANPDLHGQPALVRTDAGVNFDWGLGSPDPSIPVDHFSARWTRPISLPAGQYRFHATADDGVRVYVDGLPIIDQWHTSAAITYNTSLSLSGGNHLLRVDHYDNTEQARVHVWWEPDDGSATDPAHAGAWRGDYYNNRDFSGSPVFSRDDPAVYFDWGTSGPGGGIGGQDFSVRWTRQMIFPGGDVLFSLKPDDGVRLWLDWAAVIDQWGGSDGKTTFTKEKNVSGGTHTVVVEYYQGDGPAKVELSVQPTNVNWLGNLRTCLPPKDAWIKVYRLAPNNQWEDLNPDGYGSNTASGQITIFGVPVDASYSWDGQPYRVEQWVKGSRVHVEGDIFAGQPAFRIQPGQDVSTTWPC